MYDSNEFDIFLVSPHWGDKQPIPAHKNILSLHSAVFASLFYDEPKRKSLEVQNFDYEVIEAMVHFVYNGELGEELMKSSDSKFKCQLWLAANKYCLTDLEHFCEDHLCSEVTSETAYYLYNFSKIHNLRELKYSALEFVNQHLLDLWDHDHKFETHFMEFDYTWTIDAYSKQIILDPHLESETFCSPVNEEQKLCLTLFPESYRNVCPGFVSLFLNYFGYFHETSKYDQVGILFSISIVDQVNGELCNTKEAALKLPLNKGYGLPNFISKKLLENYFLGDSLKIHCKIAIPIQSDIELKVGKYRKSFSANRKILSSKSPIFALIFENCESSSVDLDGDVDEETFELILKFLYSKQLDSNVTFHKLVKLLDASIKYELQELKHKCEELLASRLSQETLGETLHLAEKYSAKLLHQKVIDFMSPQSGI